MKRLGLVLLLFGYMVLAIEAIKLGVAWWRGEVEYFGAEEWLILATLPVLAWIWWRHLSPFGHGRGRCLLPEDREKRP